jgi:hypothetical protein
VPFATFPLYPHEPTSSGCEQSQERSPLFDRLVGKLLEMQRHVEAEYVGGLEVDDQFVPAITSNSKQSHATGCPLKPCLTPEPTKSPLRYPGVTHSHLNRSMPQPFLNSPQINSLVS